MSADGPAMEMAEQGHERAVTVNGEPRRVPQGLTVAGLVAQLGHEPRSVAVERNGAIVPRSTWPDAELAEGDRLEIVGFVQGG